MMWLLLLALNCVLAQYYEHLDVTPISRTDVLSNFHFSIEQETSNSKLKEYTVFPRSLGQILDQSEVQELHLTFGHGFWDVYSWGTPPQNGKSASGIGVEIWAWISADTQFEAVLKWKKLVNSLGGYFCASLNFVDETQVTHPKPDMFTPQGQLTGNTFLLRGALPAEPVCTENLTPFLKLLPCQSNAGIGSLLDGHHLFNSKWQNMNVDFYKPKENSVKLDLTVANVMDSSRNRADPLPWPTPDEELVCDESKSRDFACFPVVNAARNYSLSSLFGKPINSWCPISTDSSVEVHLADNWQVISNNQSSVTKFNLQDQEFLDLELRSETASNVLPHHQPPFYVDRSFSGYGQQRGGLRATISNNLPTKLVVNYLETIPWFMKIYLHTLEVQGDGQLLNTEYTPSQQRTRPSLIQLTLEIEPNSSVNFEYTFDKSMIFIEEYPPDANHGFEISPALVVSQAPNKYEARTTSLLLSLPVPDFSMPYNVIILTATTMGLAFGSLFNLLIKKPVPKELAPEINKKQEKPIQKILGFVFQLLGK